MITPPKLFVCDGRLPRKVHTLALAAHYSSKFGLGDIGSTVSYLEPNVKIFTPRVPRGKWSHNFRRAAQQIFRLLPVSDPISRRAEKRRRTHRSVFRQQRQSTRIQSIANYGADGRFVRLTAIMRRDTSYVFVYVCTSSHDPSRHQK